MSTTKKSTVEKGTNLRNFTKFTVINHAYHRNGISGIGFHALHIKWPEEGYVADREAVVTINGFDVENRITKKPHDPDTRVLMLDEMGGVDIEQTMRGDHFHEALIDWLIKLKF